MNLQQPFFIISAATDKLTDAEINERTDILLYQIHGQGFGAALCNGTLGDYDEPAIVVVDSAPGTTICADLMLRLARIYQQDSILSVDANGLARLVFTDDPTPLTLGIFTAVSENVAKREAAYTEKDGRYYICVPLPGNGDVETCHNCGEECPDWPVRNECDVTHSVYKGSGGGE